MIRDQNIDAIRKRKYFSIGDLFTALTTPATGTITQGEGIQAAAGTVGDAPVVFLGELSTFGISGIQFASTTADILCALLRIPYDLDPKFPVGFRYHYSASAAASAGRGVTWTSYFKALAKGATIVTVASVDTALDNAFGNSLNTGANANEWSDRGVKKNGFGLSRKQIELGAVLQISIETVHNSSPGTITMFGLEMDYVPYTTVGGGHIKDAPYRSDYSNSLS